MYMIKKYNIYKEATLRVMWNIKTPQNILRRKTVDDLINIPLIWHATGRLYRLGNLAGYLQLQIDGKVRASVRAWRQRRDAIYLSRTARVNNASCDAIVTRANNRQTRHLRCSRAERRVKSLGRDGHARTDSLDKLYTRKAPYINPAGKWSRRHRCPSSHRHCIDFRGAMTLGRQCGGGTVAVVP